MAQGGRYNINTKDMAIDKISVECGMSGRGACLIRCNEKRCVRCSKVFKPNSNRHIYCGNWKVKNTCAYIFYYLSRRARNYGVTGKCIEDLYKKQLGMCAICGKNMNHDYNIDHSHITGKVRGLLCRTCNVGLSYIERDEDWFNKVLKYLEIDKIRVILKEVV